MCTLLSAGALRQSDENKLGSRPLGANCRVDAAIRKGGVLLVQEFLNLQLARWCNGPNKKAGSKEPLQIVDEKSVLPTANAHE
jgi:hypothetical protein